MRPHTNDVLAGLREHAAGRQSAIRSGDLARKIRLSARIVSNALNWLAVENKHPGVRREKEIRAFWYKYWWDGGSDR